MLPAAPVWTAEERAHWRPRDRLTPSAWAAARRRIVSKDAAEPGPWRHERAPWAVEILDALGPGGPREVVFVKSARVAGTETGLNWGGWIVDESPAPWGICFPTIEDAREYLQEELRPFLGQHARQHLLGEDGADSFVKSGVRMDHMRIRVVFATSARRLARWTAKRAFGDEVDKWPAFVGKDGSPIALLRRRLQTFGEESKLYLTSTPTTKTGNIWREFQACADRRYFWVPCPHCGDLQRLVWTQLRWPDLPGLDLRAQAERISAERLAWYECGSCKGRIDEQHRAAMAAAGRWRSEGYDFGERPPAERVGYHISALYSTLGITLHAIVATRLRALAAKAEGDIGPLFEFVTQVLGLPYEDEVDAITDPLLMAKKARNRGPARVVPAWAARLICTADTQAKHFKWMTAAWGRGKRARVIDRGRAESFQELEQKTLGARYAVEGYEVDRGPLRAVHVAPSRLYIDSGGGGLNETGDRSRTMDVYAFALARAGRVQPVKGWGGKGMPAALISDRRIKYEPPGAKPGAAAMHVRLLVLDTQTLKDQLAAYLREGIEPPGPDERLEIAAELLDEQMVRELTAESKVMESRGGARVLVWQGLPGRCWDYWDCLVYQLAAAEVEGVVTLPGPEELARTWAERARGGPPRRPGEERPPWVDGTNWWGPGA